MPENKSLYLHSTLEANLRSILEQGLKTKEGRGTLTRNLGMALNHLENKGVIKTFEDLDGPINEPAVILLISPKTSKIYKRLGSEIEVFKDQEGVKVVGLPAKWINRNEFAVFSPGSTHKSRQKQEVEYHTETYKEKNRWKERQEVKLSQQEIVGFIGVNPELLALRGQIFAELSAGKCREQEWTERLVAYLKKCQENGLLKLNDPDITIEYLADFIVEGICENYIVNLVRKLYLSLLQKKMGAKILDDKHQDKYSNLLQQVPEMQQKLGTIKFINPRIERYRNFAIHLLNNQGIKERD